MRNVTLLPSKIALQCARALGRGERTIRFLTAMSQPQPRAWELAAEHDKLAANEYDPLLEEELAEEEEYEAPLASELVHTHVEFAEAEGDGEKAAVYRLRSVPPALDAQLKAYKDWRLQPLCFQRSGNAVVDVTADNDCTTVLRFLAYAQAEHGVDPPSLDLFGKAALASIAQAWLDQMRGRELMFSTLANYTNTLCNIAAYWFDGGGDVEDGAEGCPDALLRLRAQCESQAKQQQLYARKPANWLEWDKAQEARVKCEEAWAKAGSLSHDKRVALLKELLVLQFHTVMPPDRVGIVRKLRWGMTLKQDAAPTSTECGAYRLDMTEARFKNSRFYGPSVTSVSALIAPTLDVYVDLIRFDFAEKPYVFSMKSAPERCLTSSQWSAYCKSIFKKWSGVACPPKMLRASFVTWIRNSSAAPEVLKEAARAMRHKKETADS